MVIKLEYDNGNTVVIGKLMEPVEPINIIGMDIHWSNGHENWVSHIKPTAPPHKTWSDMGVKEKLDFWQMYQAYKSQSAIKEGGVTKKEAPLKIESIW